MTNETIRTTMTMRETARKNVIDSVTEAATKSHERNYEKLHVLRDGTVSWFESTNKSDDIIDRQADGFAAIPSVGTFGTGGYACNCDYCDEVYSAVDEQNAIDDGREYDKSAKYATQTDAIADAVGNSDLGDIEAEMLRQLDSIEAGYFDDEAK